MAHYTNSSEIIGTESSNYETTSKSKRLNYEQIKELCNRTQFIREQLHKSQTKEILEQLDQLIEDIGELEKSSSKYLEADEVLSDLEWIREYYEKEEWTNVTRWLSNIDSSLREMWSDYIEKIIAKKNADQSIQKQS